MILHKIYTDKKALTHKDEFVHFRAKRNHAFLQSNARCSSAKIGQCSIARFKNPS